MACKFQILKSLTVSDFIFYPKPLYTSFHQSFFYSFITILLSESDFTLHYSTVLPKPLFRHVDFHFRTYKRDLVILTVWWQQRIAWWELLNAACQIIWVICNSLLLLKSLPINVINCIKFYVNCSALTGAYD